MTTATIATTADPEPRERILLRALFPNGKLEAIATTMGMPLEEMLKWVSAEPLLHMIQAGRMMSDAIAQAAKSDARLGAVGKLVEIINELEVGETLRRACNDIIRHDIIEPPALVDLPQEPAPPPPPAPSPPPGPPPGPGLPVAERRRLLHERQRDEIMGRECSDRPASECQGQRRLAPSPKSAVPNRTSTADVEDSPGRGTPDSNPSVPSNIRAPPRPEFAMSPDAPSARRLPCPRRI